MRKFYSLLLLLCLSSVACNTDWMFKREDQKPDIDVVTPVQEPEFRCLILEETSQRSKLTAGQLAVLQGKLVDDYMKEHCVKNTQGKPDFHVYDKDLVKVKGAWLKVVKDNPPKSLPWFYVTNGTKGLDGAVPKGKDAPAKFIEIIKPYAEPK